MVEPRPEQEVTAAPVLVAPPAGRAPVALATLALVIAAAALAGILRGVMAGNQLDTKLAALEATQAADDRAHARLSRSIDVLGNAVTLLSDEQVDLGNSKLQHLRHGFAVSEIKSERQDTGVLVAGRMINSGSLRYRDATFRVKVGNTAQEFVIASLPPGSSGAFEVLLPNLPMENARTATFSLVSSAVEYAR
jgi:hypothetical protein